MPFEPNWHIIASIFFFFFFLAGTQSVTEECHYNSVNLEDPQNRWLRVHHVLMICKTVIPKTACIWWLFYFPYVMLPYLLVWFFSLSDCVLKSALVCVTVHDIFEDTGLNFFRVMAVSAAADCWRFCLACSFQQDHCQNSIRSAMALLAKPSNPPRVEVLQLPWAVFPSVLPSLPSFGTPHP